jgi:outer membrane scaffolding protein for murein synthesis (MipA/OmpV family)
VAFAAGLLACAALVHAEIPPFYSLGPRPAEDVLAAGVLFFHAPRYAGSDQLRTVIAPSGTAILVNGFFADPISGVGFNFSADPRLEAGLRATLGLGREEVAALRGLGTIRNAPNAGGFANYNVTGRFQLQSALRYGSGYDHHGMLVDVGASYDIFQQDHVSVTLDASASYANGPYMRSYYGVSDAQAAASGYGAYRPGAGVQWRTAGLSITAPVHPKALGFLSLEYTRLAGQAAASPYARKADSISIQANVSYGF